MKETSYLINKENARKEIDGLPNLLPMAKGRSQIEFLLKTKQLLIEAQESGDKKELEIARKLQEVIRGVAKY